MPRVLIANFNNEAMMADRSALTYEFACFSAIAAAKHMWFAEPGDIVVMPERPSAPMARYASRIMGFAFDEEVVFITPEPKAGTVRLVGFESLFDPAFLSRLQAAMSGKRDWTLLPYYYDRSIAALARHLDIPLRHHIEALRLNGGHELLNDKKAFRSMAAARGIPLAEGASCGSKDELRSAFKRLLPVTGAVIVKQNRHACTAGNIILKTKMDIRCQGAPEALEVERLGSLDRNAEIVWSRLASGAETTLIVEAFHNVQAICYAEFEITETDRGPVFLNWGDQRMESTFAGLEIPGAMPAFQAATFLAGAADLARMAKDLGFLGPMNVDGIVTNDGTVLFNEVNGRYGGCTYVHHLAQRLAGPGYGDRLSVLTRNKVFAASFEESLSALETQGLAFDERTNEGIVVTGEDAQRTGTLSIMTFGQTRACAKEIEAKFLLTMASADTPSTPLLPATEISQAHH